MASGRIELLYERLFHPFARVLGLQMSIYGRSVQLYGRIFSQTLSEPQKGGGRVTCSIRYDDGISSRLEASLSKDRSKHTDERRLSPKVSFPFPEKRRSIFASNAMALW